MNDFKCLILFCLSFKNLSLISEFKKGNLFNDYTLVILLVVVVSCLLL